MPLPTEHPELVEHLQLAAGTTAAVLITAADAVAAEAFARVIHMIGAGARPFVFLRASGRADPELVRTLCRDAVQAAGDGTLFIPDLQESSRRAQDALLEELPQCRGRIVSAAAPELFWAVEQGRFSNRLFYRLNILHFCLGDEGSEQECATPGPLGESRKDAR